MQCNLNNCFKIFYLSVSEDDNIYYEKEESKPEETEELPAGEKKRLGERISTFLSKLKPSPAEKKGDEAETQEEKTEKEEEQKEKVELDQEPKDETIPQKRRGSETSV